MKEVGDFISLLNRIQITSFFPQVSRMEHQQLQQQQQFLTLEGLEYSNARALFVKACNILLTIAQVTNLNQHLQRKH